MPRPVGRQYTQEGDANRGPRPRGAVHETRRVHMGLTRPVAWHNTVDDMPMEAAPNPRHPMALGRPAIATMAVALVALALVWATTGVASATLASQAAQTERVSVSLLAERPLVPGEQAWLLLRFQIIPEWHIYWKNPGDSGARAEAAWTVPAGFTVGDLRWPAPERLRVGPLMNYGYSGEALLLAPIQVPADYRADHARIVADLAWLVCKVECIPEEAALRLDVPVDAAGDRGAAPGAHAELFERARARLPEASPWPVSAQTGDARYRLTVGLDPATQGRVEDLWFFPDQYGVIKHAAEQPLTWSGAGAHLSLVPDGTPPTRLSGVVKVVERLGPSETVSHGFSVSAALGEPPPGDAAEGDAPRVGGVAGVGLLHALGLAVLGGLVLNLMPCVFPVLALKALGLVSHSAQGAGHQRMHGLVYTLGVLTTFAVIAGVLLGVRAAGMQVGWGFQLQSPLVIALLAYLMLAVGLMLSGVFTVGSYWGGAGERFAAREGLGGAFFTGALAVVVATPCTAPFMGAALGFAVTQPPLHSMSVFLALGLGLALPYLLVTFIPALASALPRPGPWMDHAKQLLAFPMYATAAWLLWVLAQQTGPDGLAAVLTGLVLVGLAAWTAGLRQRLQRTRVLATATTVVCLSAALAVTPLTREATSNASLGASPSASSSRVSAGPDWEAFSHARLEALRASGEPVFVNMTAAWCITCLVNERVALSSRRVSEAFERHGIHYLKGDWTQRDPEITALLERFGRSGVPLYLLYPAQREREPMVLPQVLTEQLVLARLARL